MFFGKRLAKILSGENENTSASLKYRPNVYTLSCKTNRLTIMFTNGEFKVIVYLSDGTVHEGSVRVEYALSLYREELATYLIMMEDKRVEIICDPPAELEVLHGYYESVAGFDNVESVVFTWEGGLNKFEFHFNPPVRLS